MKIARKGICYSSGGVPLGAVLSLVGLTQIYLVRHWRVGGDPITMNRLGSTGMPGAPLPMKKGCRASLLGGVHRMNAYTDLLIPARH